MIAMAMQPSKQAAGGQVALVAEADFMTPQISFPKSLVEPLAAVGAASKTSSVEAVDAVILLEENQVAISVTT